MTANSPTVAILAYPQTSASIVYGMYDLFASVGREWGLIVDGTPGPSLFKPVVIAAQPGVINTVNGLRIEPHTTFADLPAPDIICVPEIALPPDAPLDGQFDDEIAWLVRCYAQGATIAAACSGALLLAEGGLLDGHEATIHWAYCDAMKRRYPQIKVREQRALVVSGDAERLVMAGGGTTWLDLALYLIARWCGVDVAMQVARISLIDWHAIGQQPFARLARSRQVEDAVIARCQTWIADHYQETAPVAAMAKLSGLAERSFKRRFQAATGMSPLEYVHTLRLEEAKQMLEAADKPIQDIAYEVGYEDAAFFSRLFKRNVNLSPAQYRRRFGSMRKALGGTASPAVD